MARDADVVVVGAGIVGLSAAWALARRSPGIRVVVVEKEATIAGHQTGRNSGVIHAGVYYAPGSAKATLCTTGRLQLVEFCRHHGVAHEICGKLVVAVTDDEMAGLAELERRCLANGVAVERVGPARIAELEPHVAGVAALHVKDTGIVDFPGVCRVLADELVDAGGELRLSTRVVSATGESDGLVVETTSGVIRTGRVVNCAGLQADRVARLFGGEDATGGWRIVPFRGEYYELAAACSHLVRNLVYPVPDARFPFLGVHLTRSIGGRVHAGPNAVLALAREGYSWRRFAAGDVAELVAFPGFRALARSHWRYGLAEFHRSLSRRRFASALARLVPGVSVDDLEPAPAGVRAQAVRRDGSLAEDFEFTASNDGRALHVLNAPSPAATASLAIGAEIAARLLDGSSPGPDRTTPRR